MATTTESECIEALRRARAQLGESPSKAQYESLDITPASATIIRACGGWNEAKEQAGLATNASTGSRVGEMPEDLPFTREEWEAMSVDQRWHYRNRGKNTERSLSRRAHIRDWLNDRKTERGCARCDEEDAACLDFHHREDEDKAGNICDLVTRGWGRERLRDELRKCVVLCANCHREEHADMDSPRAGARAHQRRIVVDHKDEQGCARCQEDVPPAALDCHHRDDTEKNTSVGRLISDGCSMDDLREELAKCVVLCANCHRKEHFVDPLANVSE